MLKIFLLVILSFSQQLWAQENYKGEFENVRLENNENIRKLVNGILEIAVVIPEGTVIQMPKSRPSVFYNYRDESGNVLRSSSGFYSQIYIVSVTKENEGAFPPDKISQINSISNGLFISKSAIPESDNSIVFKPLVASPINSDYLFFFNKDGKSKINRNAYFTKRFGDSLNKSIDLGKLSVRERLKWSAIYEELKSAGNRTGPTPTDYLYIKLNLADKYTKAFELTGETRPKGAWTMAVNSTAVRHGFPNVPCAEFMSEMIRQAYNRAGYDFTEDFNYSKDNYLIWDKSAAVVNLANSLFKGGWIPWELNRYAPPIGAIMMHEMATSPGHTYMIAGDDGRFIMDNGSPAGRDLRATSKKIIDMMFNGGVFFLPPGIVPGLWP